MLIYVLILFFTVFSINECQGAHNRNPKRPSVKQRNIYDPDIRRNVSELIRSKGYPVEEHRVLTEDGFLLSVQRIPHGAKPDENEKKEIVLLQHGLLAASDCFVLNFPNQSLGFILADAGYDVWMGNTRGNVYSRRHAKYSPRSKKFWDFSFDQMAQYDLPATIDYILNFTGQENLTYIGHSQGTTSAFALLSESPKYNEKIKLYIALAPVATIGHVNTALKYLAPLTKDIHALFMLLGVREFRPQNQFMKYLIQLSCENPADILCRDIMHLYLGTDRSLINKTRVAVYGSHFPAGTSVKSVIHVGQMVNSGKFVKYDYGIVGNVMHYSQADPPEYNVTQITTPVALLRSTNDKLADPADVALLRERLSNIVSDYEVPFALFTHHDFMIAVNAKELVYDHVLDLLKKNVKCMECDDEKKIN